MSLLIGNHIKSLSTAELEATIKQYEKIISLKRASYEDYEDYVLCQLELALRQKEVKLVA
jgi:hypothetical protein